MNEQELKRRFFAQYLGQKYEEMGVWSVLHFSQLSGVDEMTLILKNIEIINQEDTLNVSTCSEKLSIANHKNVILKRLANDTLTINQVDLLRSKGYLIPFMNLSVDEIIKKGWVKYE